MTVYLFNFNNYYNRQVIGFKTIDEYIDMYDYLDSFIPINFIEGDDIQTELVCNSPEAHHATYLIVCDSDDNILTRWYVVDQFKNCNGQYKLKLVRDLVYDYYDNVIEAPCFIEKATVDADDPAIYNLEDMTFNQIKTRETLLKDKTQVPWLVAYIAKDNALEANIPAEVDFTFETVTSLEAWAFNKYRTTPARVPFAYTYTTNVYAPSTFQQGFKMTSTDDLENEISYGGYKVDFFVDPSAVRTNVSIMKKAIAKEINEQFKTKASLIRQAAGEKINAVGATTQKALMELPGQIIYDQSTGRYYQCTVKFEEKTETFSINTSDNLFYVLNDAINLTEHFYYQDGATTSSKNGTYKLKATCLTMTVDIKDFSTIGNVEITIPATGRTQTENLPYDIIAFPYEDLEVAIDANTTFESVGAFSMRAMNALIANYGGENPVLIDAQLLPYCPVPKFNGDLTELPNTSYTVFSDADGKKCLLCLYAPSAQFSVTIDETIPYDPTRVKVENQTDMYRLCSPNWSSQFEFSAAKNKGVAAFIVDCVYKPFNPYIHVAPIFSGLYGIHFGDARGLICGGDFSLTQASNAWETYERQNKNYQLIFDRQIENMEVQQTAGRISDIVNAVAGTAQGAVLGYQMGTIGGLSPKKTAGAAIGAGAASAAGGIADIAINESLRKEALDYTKDVFGYQLGNVKALPNTLTKVSAFNQNNRVFPLLEYYTCTDIEKEALENKIKYSGMTVMRIGKIKDFLQEEPSFIQGQLIRLEWFNDNYHIANALANEIRKGVFI